MRFAKWSVLALALSTGALASGCGSDGLGPPNLATEIGVHDLDVWVPPLTRSVGLVQSSPIDWPNDRMLPANTGASIRDGGTPTAGSAYIGDTFLVSGWSGDELWYEYGMIGLGTGYSMIPSVDITKPDWTKLPITQPGGIQLNVAPIPVSFTPAMRDVIRTGVFCGLTSNVNVEYRSYLGIKFDPFPLAFSSSKSRRSSASQPACPAPAGGGGGGGNEPGGYVSYCRYEAYFTSGGELIAITFLGCSTFPLNAA